MEMETFEIIDYGDSAVLVEVSKVVTEDAWSKIHGLAKALAREKIAGITTIYPTYTTILIVFNCLVTDRAILKKHIRKFIENTSCITNTDAKTGERYRLPVVFGGEWGPDLPFVVEHLGIPEEEVIRRFCAGYRKILTFATFCGFLMQGAPFEKRIPRCKIPHTKVLGGCVEVAGNKTAFIPVTTSSGWRVIGHCPVKVIDLDSMPPVPYNPGDYIEFFPIREEEQSQYEGKTIYEMKVTS